MKDTTSFKERFQRWKNGMKVYDAGKPIEDTEEEQDPSLRAALEYALSLKIDEYNNGKDDVAGGYDFNAIKQISQNAPLSYGSYYDLTGDYKMDNRLPKYKGGKASYTGADDLISHYEGFSDTVYQKKGDVPTGGYGTTAKKWIDLWRRQGKISKQQALQAMNEHLNDTVVPTLQKRIPGYNKMPEQAQWVLQDILYNIGEGNMFQKSPNFMKAIKSGDWSAAAVQMDWDNNKPGFSKGAKERNQERQKLWRSAWGINDEPVQETKQPTLIEAMDKKLATRFIPPPIDPYIAPLSPAQAAYNPSVPAYINKDAGVTTWPRSTVLPSIIDAYNSIISDNTLPLQPPVR